MDKLEFRKPKEENWGFIEKEIVYNGEVRGSILKFTNFHHTKYESGYDVLLDGKCFILPITVSLKKEIKRRIENATDGN